MKTSGTTLAIITGVSLAFVSACKDVNQQTTIPKVIVEQRMELQEAPAPHPAPSVQEPQKKDQIRTVSNHSESVPGGDANMRLNDPSSPGYCAAIGDIQQCHLCCSAMFNADSSGDHECNEACEREDSYNSER